MSRRQILFTVTICGILQFTALTAALGAESTVVSRLKAAIGLGPTKEIPCLVLLRTARELTWGRRSSTTYTLNTFGALQNVVRLDTTEPGLPSGFAILEGTKVREGTLSKSEIAERLTGILNVRLNQDSSNEELGFIAFSPPESVSAQKLVDDIVAQMKNLRRFNPAISASRWMLTTIKSVFLGLSIGMAAQNPMTAPVLLGLYYWLDGLAGLQKSLPGGNFSVDYGQVIDSFLEEPASGPRETLLLSSTTEMPAELVRRLTGQLTPNDQLWGDSDILFSIMSENFPKNMFRIVGLGDAVKTTWVMTDFIVEKQSDGKIEVHLLVQFAKSKPKFTRKLREREAPEEEQENAPGWATPGLVPVRR